MRIKTKAGTAAIAMAIAWALLFSAPAFCQKAKSGATLTNVKGSVNVMLPGKTEEQPATNNMAVAEGTVLKTSAKSSVMLRLADGSLVKIGPFSHLTIARTPGDSGKVAKLEVSSGKMFARVKKLGSDSEFTVKTPTAIAGVRGTYYSSEVDDDASSRFDVFEGEVAVSSVSDPGAEVILKANQTTSVQQGKAPTAPAAIPKERQGEAEEGISDGEAAAATLDIGISVEPQNIVVGGKAVVTVQIMKDGQPLAQEVPLHLKVNSAAVFSNGGTEIDVTTGKDGAASLELTGVSEENVQLEASVVLKVKKKKSSGE